MSWIQQLRDFIRPTQVKCDEPSYDPNAPFDNVALEDEFEAHQSSRKHKVPGFQHFFNSVLMVTGNYDMIKGFRFEFALPLSEYFTMSHAWSFPNSGTSEEANPMNPMMPTQQKFSYTFTTQLVQDVRGQEPHVIMMGKADSDGKVDAIFIKKLNKNLSLRLTGAFHNSNVNQGLLSADLDIEDDDSMSVLRWGQGHFGFSIMQRVHPNLMVGFDYTNLMTQKLSFMSYGFKVFVRNHSFFGQYTGIQDLYNLGYIIPIKKGTQFVAQYKYDGREKEPNTILGLKQRYQQSEILSTISAKGEITSSLTFKSPNYSLKLCALVDYMKQKYSFGYGITLGQVM